MTNSRQRNRPGPGEGAARAEAAETVEEVPAEEAAPTEEAEAEADAEGRAMAEAEAAEEKAKPDAPHKATAITEPIKLDGPFTVAGGNVLDAGGQKVAICGFDHNRANSGPVIADAVATALNRFYRTPLPAERDAP